MSRINEIESKILSLSGGAYQKMMDAYLCKRYGFSNIMCLGSHAGTDKTTKGTPDSFVKCEDGRYILIQYGSVGSDSYKKIKEDILKCLDQKKTGLERKDIAKIICCHTSTNLNPGQDRELRTYFDNTELIGLNEVAQDLCTRWQDIAEDHLGIKMDTGQILEKKKFLEKASQNPYSTSLESPLLCRENELKELERLLDSEQLIFLVGPSGAGKTHLALEAAESYAKKENYIFKVIRSNGLPIYEDLVLTFSDNNDYMILVDDADQLMELNHLLELCTDSKRQHKMKIMMTVRDYAKENLKVKANKIIRPYEYQVDLLKDEAVGKILKENLGITNTACIDQINLLAKGNVRLAIMAGMCALQGNIDEIVNIFHLCNNYYQDTIKQFDRDELLTAGMIAFFDRFRLKEDKFLIELIQEQCKITFEKFSDICFKLHKWEIISIYERKAVKFENQNIRDYLLYYVFFKEKWISLSDLIELVFPRYQNRIIYCINTMCHLFYSDENNSYIENEIYIVWNKLKKSKDDSEQFTFLKVFCGALPEETLKYMKEKIDVMPEKHTDLLAYDFMGSQNKQNITSEYIEMLGEFKNTEYFFDAIELALYYFQKDTSEPMDMKLLFTKKWGIGKHSHEKEYEEENILIKKLRKNYEEAPSVLSGYGLLFAAEYHLKNQYDYSELIGNSSLRTGEFGLWPCEGLYCLRKSALDSLFLLLKFEPLKQDTVQAILNYPLREHTRIEDDLGDKNIFEQDLNFLSELGTDFFQTDDFDLCRVMYHFECLGKMHNIKYPEFLSEYKKNDLFKIYEVFDERYLRIVLHYKLAEVERIKKQKVEKIIHDVSENSIESFWELLKTQPHLDQWSVARGISLFFEILANEDKNKFITCCKTYLLHGTPYDNQSTTNFIITHLVRLMGYKKAFELVNSYTFEKKAEYFISLCYNASDECIDDRLCEKIFDCLNGEIDGKNYIIDLRLALKIDEKYEGFLLKYLSQLNGLGEKNPLIIAKFLASLCIDSEISFDKVCCRLKNNIQSLCTAYIYGICTGDYFDYEGKLFHELYSRNPKLIDDILMAFNNKAIRQDHLNYFTFLWDEKNYMEIFAKIIENEIADSSWFYPSILPQLLCYEEEHPNRNLRREKWILSYIEQNAENIEAMRFLFLVLDSFAEEIRMAAILKFCSCNPSIEDFRKISLIPHCRSWSGSEIPLIEKDIAFYQKLKDNLTGIEFIEHKAYLNEQIQMNIKRKEGVRLDDYLEEPF